MRRHSLTVRIVPLSKDPLIIEIPSPTFSSEIEDQVEEMHQLLVARPNGWDGQLWFVSDFDCESVHVWAGRYSHYLTHKKLGEKAPDELRYGNLAIIVMVRNQRGKWLWQKRSDDLIDGPGLWVQAVTGAVELNHTPRESALKETSEEIGLHPSAFSLFQPVAIVSSTGEGASVVYLAELKPNEKPTLSKEVSALAWAECPQNLGEMYGRLGEMHSALVEVIG